ncbi:hypothetical protein NCTGTJJY_CDS0257 [Serratia phage 92A1]|nr:hypothetical protein NCTGTJJY_CDS0257 [Serratia phage 92A1]
MIKINKEDSGSLRVTREEELGYIRFCFGENREFPYEAKKGCRVQFFACQRDAFDWIVEEEK